MESNNVAAKSSLDKTMPIRYQILHDVNTIQVLLEPLYQQIFGITDFTKFRNRLENKTDFAAVIAWDDTKIIGFKLGYRYSQTTFYSWLGGILPFYRGQGVGQRLMEMQHQYCKQEGYQKIQTKTMNQWKKMLILNLQNGFDITQTYTDSQGILKIILEKNL